MLTYMFYNMFFTQPLCVHHHLDTFLIILLVMSVFSFVLKIFGVHLLGFMHMQDEGESKSDSGFDGLALALDGVTLS